jgi:predicted phage terminase large subunit-like protein
MEIRPQPGPQMEFLSTPADIAIYGGAAGGGKTFGLLLEPTRHIKSVPGFGGVIFRRNATQIRNEGGMWDESEKLYPLHPLSAVPRENTLDWTFPPFGNSLSFAHLEYEKDIHSWQGAQIAFIGFDELTHFTEKQFFYMLSRNRSTCGTRPYVRATTNPDADSWVAGFIAWWIDQETGLPIPERSGVLRWVVRIDDTLQWGDTPEDLAARYPGIPPKSVTFIPARLEDNKILEARNPDYRANLMALSYVERERLLGGNWKVKPSAGTVFQREWFEIVDAAPKSTNRVRFWDKAATKPSKANADPDYTVGVLLSESGGSSCIEDVIRLRENPGETQAQRRAVAQQDGTGVRIRDEQEPGSSGKTVAHTDARDTFAGHDYKAVPSTGSKEVRARPVAAAAYNRLIRIVRGPWNEALLAELHAFPDGPHDDQVDGLSGAFNDCAARAGGSRFVAIGGNRTW